MKSFEEIRRQIYKEEYKSVIESLRHERMELQKEYVAVKQSADALMQKLVRRGIDSVVYPDITERERTIFATELDAVPMCKADQIRNEVRRKYDAEIIELQNCIEDLKIYIKKYKLLYKNGTIALMTHKEEEPTDKQLRDMILAMGNGCKTLDLSKIFNL